MFTLIRAWINGWVNNDEAGYLRRNRAHYDITVMVNPYPLHPVPITLSTSKQGLVVWNAFRAAIIKIAVGSDMLLVIDGSYFILIWKNDTFDLPKFGTNSR